MDNYRNFIIRDTEETRQVLVVQKGRCIFAPVNRGTPKPSDGSESYEERKRNLGLVMVPGKHLVKVEVRVNLDKTSLLGKHDLSQATDWEAAQNAPPKTDVSDEVSEEVTVATVADVQNTESTAISSVIGADDDSDTAGDHISAATAMGCKQRGSG